MFPHQKKKVFHKELRSDGFSNGFFQTLHSTSNPLHALPESLRNRKFPVSMRQALPQYLKQEIKVKQNYRNSKKIK